MSKPPLIVISCWQRRLATSHNCLQLQYPSSAVLGHWYGCSLTHDHRPNPGVGHSSAPEPTNFHPTEPRPASSQLFSVTEHRSCQPETPMSIIRPVAVVLLLQVVARYQQYLANSLASTFGMHFSECQALRSAYLNRSRQAVSFAPIQCISSLQQS